MLRAVGPNGPQYDTPSRRHTALMIPRLVGVYFLPHHQGTPTVGSLPGLRAVEITAAPLGRRVPTCWDSLYGSPRSSRALGSSPMPFFSAELCLPVFPVSVLRLPFVLPVLPCPALPCTPCPSLSLHCTSLSLHLTRYDTTHHD